MKRLAFALALVLLLAVPARAEETGLEAGGVHILKTDVKGKPLAGAVFQLVRELEPGELTDSAVEKRLEKINGKNTLVALVSFWPQREMTGSRVQETVTDENGQAAIYGLPFGAYYLVETQAPAGYNRMEAPVRLSIHRYSHLTAADSVRDDEGKLLDNTLQIVNIRCTLPDPSGLTGTVWIAGVTGLLFSAVALILVRRRKRGW